VTSISRSHFGEPAKPFFWDSEGVLKSKPPIEDPDQQWGSIMSAFIIGLVCGPSCEKYPADLARHRPCWS
jgi:hypothetical protein